MYSNRNISKLLYGLSAITLAAAVYVAWWGLSDIEFTPNAPPHQKAVHDQGQSNASKTPALDAFKTAWSLELQRPLYDPPPVVVNVAPPPPPKPPRVRLSGTFVEPGNSRALIQDRTGVTHVCRLGEVIDEATVSAITEDGVVVAHDNANWQLRVGKEPVQQ